ncbi:MAG: prenyltransferase/squalene oxidase repeat-containing protein [Planctomycetota bacterium]|jgi:hypothetical protein
MAVRFLHILFVWLLLFSVATAAPKNPRKDPKFWKEIDGTIDRGVAWLLQSQKPTGRWAAFEDKRGAVYELGMQALCTLACVKGGVPLDDPRMVKAFRALRSIYDKQKNNLQTYEVGLTLMLLDARAAKQLRRFEGKKDKAKRKLGESELEWVKALALWLQMKQKPQGMWRYPANGVDVSNTQYAALGLWSAHRLGVRIDKGVVRRMMESVLQRQQTEGTSKVPFYADPERVLNRKKGERSSSTYITAAGWRYNPPEKIKRAGKMITASYPYSGSMTTAGIAILAIGRDILTASDSWNDKVQDGKVRRAMWQGLAWLQAHWDVWDNPGHPGNWVFYWLYGLERAGQLCGVIYVGLHDWYVEGAKRLMEDQRPDGSWPLRPRRKVPDSSDERWQSDQVDTAFAILFLTRSTPKIKTPMPTITGGK